VRWVESSHPTERITLREFVAGFTAALERAKAHAAQLENERASREFLEAILWAQEGERERIALGLHDGPAQSMISAMRYVESTMALPEADELPVQNHLERSVELIADAVRQMREVITDLIPPDLEVMGLGGAIHQHLERSANEAHWMIETQLAKVNLPRESEVALYRIFVESLNNVRRHANAKRVSVKLEQHGEEVKLHVQDDGIGFEPSSSDTRAVGSIGTIGMRKRAELIGGQFHIESQPGAGTSVRVAVPARSIHEPVG
jgi:two-component system NarL family sensor kinase